MHLKGPFEVELDSFDEAIRFVNANDFGNGTAVFTRSGAAARKFVDEIEAGQARRHGKWMEIHVKSSRTPRKRQGKQHGKACGRHVKRCERAIMAAM